MLKQLYIQNFTLIDKLEMCFHPGFSVITGETGAGKSIIIGAIGLLLGNRADAKQVKSGTNKCVVEATFDLTPYEQDPLVRFFDDNDLDYQHGECILRREVSATGKSRAFINDTPVTLTTLRELGGQLVDIHSQHQNLLLAKEDFQMEVVDIMAHDKVQLATYQNTFHQYKTALNDLEKLRNLIAERRKSEDFIRYQYNELSDANLQEEEQEELEQASEMMSHAEEIKSVLHETDDLLNNEENGTLERTRNMANLLHSIEDSFPIAKDLADRVDNCFIDLKDISRELSLHADDVEFEPQRLQETNARLDLIYTLEQKYSATTVADLIVQRDALGTQLNSVEHSEEQMAEQEERVKRLLEECNQCAATLTTLRKKSALAIEKELSTRLVPLGIPKIRFHVDITPCTLNEKGADKIQFLFSSNSSSPMQPISEVASGGEIARVMLSLKAMISKAIGLPTIIFDEIDTGVSGHVAEKMAKIMKEMGENNRQVICITHLPQIAALGATHYKVSKTETADGTKSVMSEIKNEERVDEIAKMLSGSEITEAAIDNAKALLNM